MRVSRIVIENFRGISAATILLPGHAVLIGDNNTGKTTILEALDLALGPDRLNRTTPVDEHDFFQGKYITTAADNLTGSHGDHQSAEGEAPRIEIEVTITDLSEEQKASFGDYTEFWNKQSNTFYIEANPAGVDATNITEALRVTFHGWYNPEEDDFQGRTYFTRSLSEDATPSIFSRTHKQICGFLYLRSRRTGSRALSLERGSLLDIILRLREVRPKMWEDTITRLAEYTVASDPALGISGVLESINASLKKYVPKEWGIEPHLKVSNLTREHLRSVITAFIATGEGRHAAPYYRQGTGTINMLVLAMLAQIAEDRQNVIFSMEEPETAIPPYAQKRIVHEIRKLASQTLFTSHSPYVLEEFALEETVVLARDAQGTLTQSVIALPESVKPKRYRQEFRTRFCEGLLARRILIAEGAAEAAGFPVACRRLAELCPDTYSSLEALGICTIDAGGETNIPDVARLYRDLGKQTFAICDMQSPEHKTLIDAEVEVALMHAEKGFEDLVLKNTTEDALIRFARLIYWPPHLLTKYPDPPSVARTALDEYFGWSKGNWGVADFLAQCDETEIPEWIREACRTLMAACTPPPADHVGSRSLLRLQVTIYRRRQMQLSEKQQQIMAAGGHLLVTGGPGSGKTTVSILKAADIAAHRLRSGQKILFLSFARATVSRVIEAIEYEQQIPHQQRRRINVETYHSFFWRVLKAHGYLIGFPRRLTILTPAAEAISLSAIRSGYAGDSKLSETDKAEKITRERAERLRLARDEGRVCFDLFASSVGEILHGSERIRRLAAAMYPVIILDEFQDTNGEQWRVVQALGQFSTLLALADPEQRIYDFIGADPERLEHFRAAFAPVEVDLSTDNYRSAGTDILMFGNDLLTGKFQQKAYNGIHRQGYEPNADQAMTTLITTAYAARTRLVKSGRKKWSLAVLVPTKKMTRHVSDAFRVPPGGMTEIPHVAAIELEGAILGAEIIALLMQPETSSFERFINLLCNYFHGRGGDTPAKGDLAQAANIRMAFDEWYARRASGRDIRKNSLLVPMLTVYAEARALTLTGDPDPDWRAMRRILENGARPRLKALSEEVRNVRLLDRGTQLRQELSEDWRDNGAYANALAITQRAFLQEHFSTNAKPETGVVVMNMHKAKGKQFDEVIIFEGWPRTAKGKIVANFDRIVRGNSLEEIDDQARQNFRVSVTRGRQRTSILTPRNDPCVLLLSTTS